MVIKMTMVCLECDKYANLRCLGMKIKLAMLSEDMNYLKRVSANFNNKFNDKLEIYLFSSAQGAIDELLTKKMDVFLADSNFEIEDQLIPKKCGFAYLVDSQDIETVRGQRTICKYQKAELIYKEILSIYSENVSDILGFKTDNGSTRLITVTSAAGGTGSSTMAVGCAKYLARTGKRVLYLSLATFGDTACFLAGDGTANFSDVLYTLKSKKSNFALKVESAVRTDKSGVMFFQSPNTALDMKELTDGELDSLITSLKSVGSYDYIVVDVEYDLNNRINNLMKESYGVIMVSNGEMVPNNKTIRALEAIKLMDEQNEDAVFNKVFLVYNKFASKTGTTIDEYNSKMIGGVPRFENGTPMNISDRIGGLAFFEKFL